MRSRICSFVVIAAVLGAMSACGDKKAKPKESAQTAQVGSGASAGSSAGSNAGSQAGSGSAAVAATNEPIVYNRLDVERYDGEKPVDFVKLKVKVPKVAVYRSFPGGERVAVVTRDTEVVQHSEYRGFYRVTFTDPEKPTQRLMGWIANLAFQDPPKLAKKYGPARCNISDERPGTQAYAMEANFTVPACEYVCRDANECEATGGKCELRMYIGRFGDVPDVWQYTTVCTLPSLVPNGPPELIGNAPGFNGRCPFGQMLVPKYGAGCFFACKKDLDCPQGSTCRKFDELKVKSKLCSTS